MSEQVKEQATAFSYQPIKGGGVSSAKGFRASGMHAGFKKKAQSLDFALVLADETCPCAAVFTKNSFCAAPVSVCREYLERSGGYARAIILNAGNANASTGAPGIETVHAVTAETAQLIGCAPEEVLAASTGVIGVYILKERFDENIEDLLELADIEGGHSAALAIMTTDTIPKEHALSYLSADPDYAGIRFTLGGMAKGAGMIMPDMATLLVALTTDAPLSPELAQKALVAAVGKSFNKVTIDSDTSTNDSCFLMASGKALPARADDAAPSGFAEGSIAYGEFCAALEALCVWLARQIALDGEGATRLVTVNVNGAASEADADLAARAVANSPLVKTAIFGRDANWGRIAMALGKSGAAFRPENVSIDLLGIPVCRDGLAQAFDEVQAKRRFEAPEIVIDVDLGAGSAATTLWTCDLTHDYISINGDYRS